MSEARSDDNGDGSTLLIGDSIIKYINPRKLSIEGKLSNVRSLESLPRRSSRKLRKLSLIQHSLFCMLARTICQ